MPPGLVEWWPYLLTLGGGYLGLLKIIQSMYEARIADMARQLEATTKERDRWEDMALRSLQVARQTTEVTAQAVATTPGAGAP